MSAARRLYADIWERKLAATGAFTPPPPNTRLAVGASVARRYGGGSLLDVGCGDGVLALLVADCFAALHGVELAPAAARRAASRGVAAAVANLDAGALPYRDASIDLVICLDVIEHVFDPAHLVGEIARVLRPSGHAIIATPNIRYWRHLRRLLFDGRFPHTSGDTEGYDGGHLHYFTYGDVETLLSAAGLLPVTRAATYGGRGRRLPRPIRSYPLFEEWLATGLFVVARREHPYANTQRSNPWRA